MAMVDRTRARVFRDPVEAVDRPGRSPAAGAGLLAGRPVLKPVDLLIVEDSPSDLALIERHLARQGLPVSCRQAATLTDVTAAMRVGPPDAVLSDYKLPGLDFVEVFEAVRAAFPHLPVILVSGTVGEERAVELLRLGVTDFVLKDNLGRLVPSIRRALNEVAERRARQEAERQLHEREARFSRLIEASFDCAWETDARHFYTWISPRVTDVLGYTPEEMVGRSCFEFMPAGEAERVRALLPSFAARRRPFAMAENLFLHRDGRPLVLESSGFPVIAADGTITGYFGASRDVTRRHDAEAALRRSNWALAAVLRANVATIQSGTDCEMMQAVCEAIVGGSVFPLAWIGLVDQDPDRSVRVASAAGPAAGPLAGQRFGWAEDGFGAGPTGRCLREGRAVIDNAPSDAEPGIVSLLSIPLIDEGTAVGALTIGADQRDVFGGDEMRLFGQFASNLVFAMKARRTQGKYQAAMDQMVETLAATIERRDPYTAEHERRVADLSVLIAREMGLDEATCQVIRLAGLVHDIGKIQIPTEILSKPGRLSAIEFELVKTHAAVSWELLRGVDFPWPLADIAGQHHERLDGSGYPKGLAGDEIRLEARIIAVADIIEAMASHRPYRPALGIGVALDEIRRLEGTHLDAAVVQAALRVCLRDGFTFDQLR